MIYYVAGFMFSLDAKSVALIKKNRPAWQKGRLNGIGGHVENGETPHAAMAREFQEEAGIITRPENWAKFYELSEGDWTVHFFTTTGDLRDLQSVTDEEVLQVPIAGLSAYKTVPNLRWLIPLALKEHHYNAYFPY